MRKSFKLSSVAGVIALGLFSINASHAFKVGNWQGNLPTFPTVELVKPEILSVTPSFKQLEVKWSSAESSKAFGDIEYTLCGFDNDELNQCKEIAKVTNQTSWIFTKESGIDNFAYDEIFVMAKSGDAEAKSEGSFAVTNETKGKMLGHLLPPNWTGNESFGDHFVMSGDGRTIVVTETSKGSKEVDGGVEYGEVYIFTLNNGEWEHYTLQHQERENNLDKNFIFGDSVAISEDGKRIAVSSYYDTTAQYPLNDDITRLRVDVYEFDGGEWNPIANFSTPQSQSEWANEGGLSFSSDGKRLVFATDALWKIWSTDIEDEGSHSDNGGYNENLYGLYFFSEDESGSWDLSLLRSAIHYNPKFISRYASSPRARISGDGKSIIVLGETTGQSGGIFNPGYSDGEWDSDHRDSENYDPFPFGDPTRSLWLLTENSNGEWVHSKTFKAPFVQELDGFGRDLSISYDGSVIVSGMAHRDLDPSSFKNNGVIEPEDLAFNPDDESNISGAGAAVAYRKNKETGEWAMEQAFVPIQQGSTDFTESLALSGDGNFLIIGEDDDDNSQAGITNKPVLDDEMNDAGAGYFYMYNNNQWHYVATIKEFNPKENNHFGNEVAISSDGRTVAISAPDTKPTTEEGLALGSKLGGVFVY